MKHCSFTRDLGANYPTCSFFSTYYSYDTTEKYDVVGES